MKWEWLCYCGNQLSPAYTMLFILKYASYSPDMFADMIQIGELVVKAHTFTQSHLTRHGHQHFMDDMNTCKKDSFTFIFFFLNGGNIVTYSSWWQQNCSPLPDCQCEASVWIQRCQTEPFLSEMRCTLDPRPLETVPLKSTEIGYQLNLHSFLYKDTFSTKFSQHLMYKFVAFQPIQFFFFLLDTYQFEHWASLQARIPIKPAEQKRINSLSFPCPQFRCPRPPQDSDIPRSLLGC